MKTSAVVLVTLNLLGVVSGAFAQTPSITAEVDLTSGYSTEDRLRAVFTQLRAFGEVQPKLQFNVEATWARRSEDTTDAFGAAYPYAGRVQMSEAYAERTFQRGSTVTSIRGGQYRTPFGIHSRADFGYSGFLRAPLVRYEGYWSVVNTMLERGVDVVVGTPRLSLEVSVGTPGDITTTLRRRAGLDGVVRAQAYYKALVVGASHINSNPYVPAQIPGRMTLSGIDARWTLGGVQVRGEWMVGQPWDGPKTKGGYLDATVHRPFMGPLTVLFRTEQLNYLSDQPFAWHGTDGWTNWRGRRQTAGGRVRLPGGITAQLNVFRHSPTVAYEDDDRTAVDVGVTYSLHGHR